MSGWSKARRVLLPAVLGTAVIGTLAWHFLGRSELPTGFAKGNGRIEAVEIDVATKAPGRVEKILVDEGDFVQPGQLLAKMDTAVLTAQRRRAEAELQRALIGIDVAKSQVAQREAEKNFAVALLAQRQAELEAARKRFTRTEKLAGGGIEAQQRLDDDRAVFEGARAAASAAEAQSAAADAAIGLAKSQVIAAESDVEAVRATIEQLQADIDDSALRSPRAGRVQYRVAQSGEVLSAGGVVLNLVDLGDVYMTFFLPTAQAGRVSMGSEVHLVLDAVPQYVIPAQATFVADVAQFTPKTVETEEERQKLMFRVKAHIDPELLRQHISQIKTGLPGVAYVRLDPRAEWPPELQIRIPQ